MIVLEHKTINDMQNIAKESSDNDSKFIIIPSNIKKFKRKGKDVNLPTDVEIVNMDK